MFQILYDIDFHFFFNTNKQTKQKTPRTLMNNWRAQFQNQINPLFMKTEFVTLLYIITLELVTEWNLDPDNHANTFFLI